MYKKTYTKPRLQVVELPYQTALLNTSPDPYDPDNIPAGQSSLGPLDE
jgi:hypothetical protein